MPLTKSGKSVRSKMRKHYGPEKGERVFYATINKHPSLKHKMKKKMHREGG